MTKNDLKPLIKKCLAEMMNVGVPPVKTASTTNISRTLKTTDQVIDALAAGKIDPETAKKLITKLSRSADAASSGVGCQY